ncbi:MAG: complex I NDUFA9 subunit family protein [Cocleimonas sp.]
MKILITGANGFIGRHIKNALAAEHQLITPTHQQVDFSTAIPVEHWKYLLEGVDVVINCVGIIVERKNQTFSDIHTTAPIVLFKACLKSNVKRIIQISALGADKDAVVPYHISKLTADNALRELDILSFILRPSLVYGEGGTSFKLFKRLASLPMLLLPCGGVQQIQPVHISDLVKTVEQSLLIEKSQTIDVVGPDSMSLAEYIQKIRSSMGKGIAKVIPIPIQVAMALSSVLHYLMPILHPDNLRMLQQGNTADVAPLIAFISVPPIAIEEVLG